MNLIDDGKEPPPQFYDQPELADEAMFYWNAFNHLGSDRQFGMGVGPIPYSSIRAYADEFDIRSRDEFDHFAGIIRSLDSEYLALVNAPKDKTDMVPISDVQSQHLMFERLKARANRKK